MIIAAAVLFVAGVFVGKMLSPIYQMHRPFMMSDNARAMPCPCAAGCACGIQSLGNFDMENFGCPARNLKVQDNRAEAYRHHQPCPKVDNLPPLPTPEVRPLPKHESKPKPHHFEPSPMPMPQPSVDALQPMPVPPHSAEEVIK